jgi:hypothetical protein
MFEPSNRHDMLTGTQADGRAFPGNLSLTCNNWTSSTFGVAMLGHHDRRHGIGNEFQKSWNSAHISRSCRQEDLIATGGNGLFYCFAPDYLQQCFGGQEECSHASKVDTCGYCESYCFQRGSAQNAVLRIHRTRHTTRTTTGRGTGKCLALHQLAVWRVSNGSMLLKKSPQKNCGISI